VARYEVKKDALSTIPESESQKARSPSKTPNKADKLVQVFRPCPANKVANQYDKRSERVLRPLDPQVLPTTLPLEQPALHDSEGREEL